MAKNLKNSSKSQRREINDFLPYLLSYGVDSLKHHQRNIEVQREELNKSFGADLSLNIQHVIANIEMHRKLAENIPKLVSLNNDLIMEGWIIRKNNVEIIKIKYI